jgi:hypothetical protein
MELTFGQAMGMTALLLAILLLNLAAPLFPSALGFGA